MQDAVEVTTQHLNQFYSVAGMVISPTHPYLRHWDLILGVCLLYVVHVTPFQVAFLAGTPSDDLPLSPFNPVVWWAVLPAVALWLILETWYLLRRQRGITTDVARAAYARFTRAGRLLAGGWAAHFVPFLLVNRALFLHHYLPAVCFGAMLSATITEHVVVDVLQSRRAHAACAAVLVAATAQAYRTLLPVVMGWPLDAKGMAELQWRPGWDIINDVRP